MLSKFLPFTKNDSKKVENKLDILLDKLISLEDKVSKLSQENKEIFNKLEGEIEQVTKNSTQIIKTVKKLDNELKNKTLSIDSLKEEISKENSKVESEFKNIYTEIHKIVKLLNKNLFLELVTNHKQALTKFISSEKKK